jgi:hypothetical protein
MTYRASIFLDLKTITPNQIMQEMILADDFTIGTIATVFMVTLLNVN